MHITATIKFKYEQEDATLRYVQAVRKFYCHGSERYFYEITFDTGKINEYHAESVKEIVLS